MTVYTLDLWLCKSETRTYPCSAILPHFTYKQYSNVQDIQVFHTFYILIFLLNGRIEEAKAVRRQLLYPPTAKYNPPAALHSSFSDSIKVSLFLSQSTISICSLNPIISHELKDFALAVILSLTSIIIISSTLNKLHWHTNQLQNTPHLKTLPWSNVSGSFPHFHSLTVHSTQVSLPFQSSVHLHHIHKTPFINFTITSMRPNTAIPFLPTSHSTSQQDLTELIILAETFPSIDSRNIILCYFSCSSGYFAVFLNEPLLPCQTSKHRFLPWAFFSFPSLLSSS